MNAKPRIRRQMCVEALQVRRDAVGRLGSLEQRQPFSGRAFRIGPGNCQVGRAGSTNLQHRRQWVGLHDNVRGLR